MRVRARFCGASLVALFTAFASIAASAQDQAVERARRLLAAGNAKEAYTELAAVQDRLSGMPEFDYLLGVAALDSGRIDEAIIAFERVLAIMPNHAGAQMDLARAYYAAGSYDLAEAAFQKLRASNPPPAAQRAISQYLETIQARKRQTRPGWTAFGELGIGYDSNITGVPSNFFTATQQSVGIGFDPTGNSVKTSAAFVQGAAGAEYHYPMAAGWTLFGGGELRGRAYHNESDFNLAAAEGHFGAVLTRSQDQFRFAASYAPYSQKGAAPGDPKPTNDRRVGGVGFDWRHSIDIRTQYGIGLQFNDVRFPRNRIENFDQVFLAASFLKTFERAGEPLLYVSAFVTQDHASHEFENGVDGTSTKSKNLLGARSYFQYSVNPKVQGFGGLTVIYRRDIDDWARSILVQRGKDVYAEASMGVAWQFRDKCALRLQYAFSHNSSNIDIYDFNRNEFSSTVRCDMI